MTRYVCYFTCHGKVRSMVLPRGLEDTRYACGGFWVDENYDYPEVADKSKYWIPAHKIEFVEKVCTNGTK